MPTSIQLTSSQIDQLKALRDQAIGLVDGVGAWTPFYQFLAQAIRNTVLPRGTAEVTVADVVAVRSLGLLPNDQLQSMIWLMGGAQVNSDSGAFSKLIREYNIREGELRGKSFSSTDLQRASNKVGYLMAEKILGRVDGTAPGNGGAIPTVLEIGREELTGIRDTLYPGNEASSAPLYLNQAWPGVLMLGKQGENFLPRLVASGTDPAKADTLMDFQDMLFAWDAFRYAFNKTGITDVVIAKDFTISLGITNWSDLPGALANVANPVWWFDLLIAQQDAGVAAILRQIHDIGSNKFLDMLRGTQEGKSLLGTTTDANFAANAKAFFGALSPTQLQALAASLMPTATSAIETLATTDVNARAALMALSLVKVNVSSTVADTLARYEANTNPGGLTDTWLHDRTEMLHAIAITRPGQNAVGSTNTNYVDVESNLTVVQRMNGVGANEGIFRCAA